MAILGSLSTSGTVRYNDLKRKMQGISNTMLVKPLKELEDDGLVKRTEYLEVPIWVEHEATQAVASLKPIIQSIDCTLLDFSSTVLASYSHFLEVS